MVVEAGIGVPARFDAWADAPAAICTMLPRPELAQNPVAPAVTPHTSGIASPPSHRPSTVDQSPSTPPRGLAAAMKAPLPSIATEPDITAKIAHARIRPGERFELPPRASPAAGA